MKEAIRCDIACVKPFLPVLISTVVVIDIVWLFAGNSFSLVGASVAMMTMLMSFSLAGYDDQSGWARFRAALPISRRSLIAGRYAVVLGFGFCAIALCVPLAIAVDSIASNAVVFEQATALFYAGVVSLAAALLLCSAAGYVVWNGARYAFLRVWHRRLCCGSGRVARALAAP